MLYRKLGKWGLRLSEIGLGSWLTYGNTVDEEASIRQIHYAVEKGINFLDTANVYARGQSEVVVGKALKDLKRDQIVLATKVFFPMADGPNDRGLSRKHIFEQCHLSLTRLNVEYIDLYQCHRYDPEVPLFELVRAMDDLTRQGKILYWGVSEWQAEHIEEACEIAASLGAMPPVSNQPRYNMLARNIEDRVIPTSSRLGLGQVVFSPLAQGVLTGKYKSDESLPANSRGADSRVNTFMLGNLNRETLVLVEKLSKLAAEASLTMPQMALAWCLRLGEITSVIIGATKASQIDENLLAAGTKLDDALLKKVDDLLSVRVR
jgi:aryl-alcohol dehydrogenase-like predicted oxidoreductase